MKLSHDKATTRALLSSPDFSKGLVDIYTGIEFQVRRPFKAHPLNFIITAQWKVSVFFRESIGDASLRNLAIKMPVIFKPNRSFNEIPEDLKRWRNKYLGHVQSIGNDNTAKVLCRDEEIRIVALSELYLEGSPFVLRTYEKLIGNRFKGPSIWHKIQQLDFALTQAGRRNPSVLKDRLHSIRKLLGGELKEQLILKLDCFQDGVLTLGLSPLKLEIK
jgi:hypothetical protein